MKNTSRAQQGSTKTADPVAPNSQKLNPTITYPQKVNLDVWNRFKMITPRNKTLVQAVEDLITEKVMKAEM